MGASGVVALTPGQIDPQGPSPGVISSVFNLTAGHGWTMDGVAASSNVNDTSDGPMSDRHLSGVTQGTGGSGGVGTNTRFTKTGLSLNLTDKLVGFLFKVDDFTYLKHITIYLGNTSFTTFNFVRPWSAAADTRPNHFQANKWQVCYIDPVDSQGSVTPLANLNSITELRIVFNDDNSGHSVNVRLGGMWLVAKATSPFPNGCVTFTIDDGWSSQWSDMKPKLSQYGFRATLFPVQDRLGTGSYMTLAQAQHLHDNLGWEVGYHATSNTIHDPTGGLSLLSAGRLDAELRKGKKWLADKGFHQGRDLMAYPQGEYNATVLSAVKKYFRAARGARLSAPDETLPPAYGDWHYKLRIYPLDNSQIISTYTAAVDAAKANKTWLLLMAHKTGAVADSLTITTTDFNTLVDYINTQGVPVRPLGEVLRMVG